MGADHQRLNRTEIILVVTILSLSLSLSLHGVCVATSSYVATSGHVLHNSGLKYEVHAMGTGKLDGG